MRDSVGKIASAVTAGKDTGAGLRIAKVTALEAGTARVRLDITGDTWVSVDADVVGLAVGERVYALQQGPVTLVAGRLVAPPPAAPPVPLGSVTAYAGSSSTLPEGWLLCDGASLSRTTYADLFAIIGTTYGTGSSSTFRLPNLAERFLLGDGAGTSLGDTGGAATVTLTTAHLPAHTHGSAGAHTHSVTSHTNPSATVASGTGSTIADNDVAATLTTSETGSHTHSSVGSGTAHENMPPHLVMHYIIRVK